MTALYDIPLKKIDGSSGTLAEYAGKVVLIVNVASKCGLTPQYASLEKAYETYKSRGLVVLGFPSNDFAGQEPGTEDEIQAFCSGTFGVQFPMYSKVSINIGERHPLYAALIAAQPSALQTEGSVLKEKLGARGLLPAKDSDVTWNFEKFLIGRDAQVIGRFAPDMTVEDPKLLAAIESALAA